METVELVRARLATGDDAGAATALVEGLGPAVYSYLCSLLDEDDARDAFSLFAEDAWRGLPGFRWECSLRSWCYRVAFRAAGRVRREAWHRRRRPLPTTAASRLAAEVATRSGMAPGSRMERLSRLRAGLDDEERTLLVLRVDRELEWDEVAAVLAEEGTEVAPATLRKRFERLKEKLAARARDEGLLDD